MLGTIVNVSTIILGSVIGALLKKNFNKNYQNALFTAMGMCALAVGIQASVSSINAGGSLVELIINMSIGSVIGTKLRLHDRFLSLTDKLSKGNNFGEGLVTAILLFCIGTLSIVGPMESALHGNNSLLFTNASLDFITSIAMASTYGIGIALAAVVLLAFQGSIYLLSLAIQDAIPDYILNNLTTTGGILIIMSGICLLNLKSIKTTDYLPALFVSPVIAYIGELLK